MRMKKLLAALLVLCTVLVAVPFTAFAAEAGAAADEEFMKVAFLDCGRKYFTPDWIIAMIKEAKAAGYTHVQLGVGNDGLRFLLDDMSINVNEKSYTNEQITSGIKAGNVKYHDCGEVNELTQADMDRIFDAAKQVGIEIIPLINTPGHMDAILHAMKSVGIDAAYHGSVRTVDVTNADGVAFCKALIGKYVDYFSTKGCKYFNIGADEYANDVFNTGGMGFAQLERRGEYVYFVKYLNDMIAVVKGANMTPMAFNDGIYYNRNTQYPIDKSLMVCYWSSGWWGYNLAPASFLAAQGFKMVNTHGDFYYVLGKPDKFDEGFDFASGFRRNTFSGSQVSNPVGAMFCIWCDFPDAETEQTVAQKVRLPLRAMADAMDEKYDPNMDQSVVPGGFNEDGSINVVPTAVTNVKLDKVNAEMKIGDKLTLTATVEPEDAANKNVSWNSSNPEVAAVENGVVTAKGCGTTTITVTTEDGNKTATCVITINHEYNDATCTTPKTCKHCGATEGDALGHKLEKVSAKEATCTENGNHEYWICRECNKLFADENGTVETTLENVTIQATGHDWEDATCTTPKTCKHCGATEGEALGHTLTKVPAKAPTVSAEGNIEHYICSVCGKYFSDAEGKHEIDKDSVVIDKLPDNPDVPETADNSNLALVGGVMLIAAIGMVAVFYYVKRKRV